MHRDERTRLGLPLDLQELAGIGLALSGGGIRSASFALGVVQVWLNENLLRSFDYMSTVSGGGYLGSAISWWLHQAAVDKNFEPTDGIPSRYEAFRQQFGSKVTGARTQRAAASQSPGWSGSNWLAYIRQHGNYLEPRGVGLLSLVGTVLRVSLYTLATYFALAVALLSAARCLSDVLGTTTNPLELFGIAAAALAGVLTVATTFLYGPATWLASTFGSNTSAFLYRARTNVRRWSGMILAVGIAGLVLWSVPVLYCYIAGGTWWASLSSASLGTVGTIYQFLQGRAQSKKPSAFTRIRIAVTAALVIYGLLLGAYGLAQSFVIPLPAAIVSLAFAILFGFFVNTNYAGLARLYRDRLMEAFLPSLTGVATNVWTLADGADVQAVGDLAGRLHSDGTLRKADDKECTRPFHVINCNVVLIDSSKDLYRNRGGDSFAISSLWSGSNATHWVQTRKLGDGALSLPTAMSISGAAANPNAGPNGLGVTRNRLVSFLMSLFNIRLGYWMSNPFYLGPRPSNRPNLWFPGFRQGLLGGGLSERARFLELTDGGHFDNTGIYELVRRRTRLIVLSEAGCDTAFTMEDLANAIEKVRVDFSVFIEFNDPVYNLDALRTNAADPTQPATRGFAIGRVRYPKGTATSPDYDDGYLVYLQAVPASAMPSDVVSHWRRNPAFPNDTTADQFFTEQNLEAYRELGYSIAGDFYKTLQQPGSEYMQQVANLLLTRRGVAAGNDPSV